MEDANCSAKAEQAQGAGVRDSSHAGSGTTAAEESCQHSVQAEVCRFVLPVFVPGLLQGKSQTVVAPMLPIFVREDLDGSDSAVGLVTSAYSLAQVCCSAAMGLILRRCHYSMASCLSLSVLVCTALASFVAPSVAVLLMIRLVGGAAFSAFDLSRKAYLSAEVPSALRGRISGIQAGMQKWAVMIAAAMSGFIAQHTTTRSVFLVQASFTGSALLSLAFHEAATACSGSRADQGTAGHGPGPSRRSPSPGPAVGLVQVARQNWRGLVGAGGFCAMLNGCRNTWMVALPLHSHNLGLSKTAIGLVVAVFRALDAVVTMTVAGHIMDRHGRSAAALPSMVLIAVAYFLLPWTGSLWTLIPVALVYALGNGLSGGILNYFATGLAPANARTQFLGLWKTVTALGGLLLPPLFGVVSDQAGSLKAATATVAAVALFAAVWVKALVRDLPLDAARSRAVAGARPLVDGPQAAAGPGELTTQLASVPGPPAASPA